MYFWNDSCEGNSQKSMGQSLEADYLGLQGQNYIIFEIYRLSFSITISIFSAFALAVFEILGESVHPYFYRACRNGVYPQTVNNVSFG